MKKQQLILIGSGILLVAALFFFGSTVPAKKPITAISAENTSGSFSTNDIISEAKKGLDPDRVDRLTKLENSVVRGDVKEQQIHVYHQLAKFWEDSVHNHLLELHYRGEAAKLENSEKNLTFAAHLLLQQLLGEEDPRIQQWLGNETKALFEKVVELDPKNDSAKIGIGASYMFGNISNEPMKGIMMIRDIAEKDPNNLYAQMMLGLGGIKSGQFDKAIERFKIVAQKDPNNLEAIFRIAETYDRKGDKINAVKWYKDAASKISDPSIKKELEERINTLK